MGKVSVSFSREKFKLFNFFQLSADVSGRQQGNLNFEYEFL